MLKINNDEIKLIIADYDGTLRDFDYGSIHNLTISEIKESVNNGCYFIMNTGNLPYEMKQSVEIIVGEISERTKYFISCNGNGFKNFLTNETQVPKVFNQNDILTFVEIFKRLNITDYQIITDDLEKIYYQNLESMNFMISVGQHPQDNLHRLPLTDEVLWTIKSSPKLALWKIDTKLREKLFNEIRKELTNLEIEYTWFMNDGVDLIPKGVSKFTGIQNVLKTINQENKTNYSLNNVIYFGDQHNDLSVFQNLKYCIAPKNASNEIKELAYDITTDAIEGGVGAYLQKIKN